MQKFVNRKNELACLESQYNSTESSFVVLYGRRRVGKTALIVEFLKTHSNSIYFLATEESEPQNLNYFKSQVADFTGNELLKTATVDWQTVFKALIDYKTETKKVIAIDEFQYLGISNSAFPSILQKIWDTILKDANIMLIICGSLVSLMKSQTLDYSSPLYGRRTAQINLKPIPYKYYHEFYDTKPDDNLLPFYAVTGGVPKYIEMFQGYVKEDFYKAIEDNILNEHSFLFEEPYFLLQKEVTEIGSYFSLIKAISMGNHKLSDIAANLELKQTGLTKYLKILMDLNLIERDVPITEKYPEKSKSGLYRITDRFITFWFKFVYPFRSFLERGEKEYVLEQIKKGFVQNYLSFVYEEICREKMWDLSSKGIWDFRFERVGRYWGGKIGEIDIVVIGEKSNAIILGECKYSSSPKGLSVLHELQKKKDAMQKLTNANDVRYIIFGASGFTQGLIEEASKDNTITLIESEFPSYL